jgi:Cytochrome P450
MLLVRTLPAGLTVAELTYGNSLNFLERGIEKNDILDAMDTATSNWFQLASHFPLLISIMSRIPPPILKWCDLISYINSNGRVNPPLYCRGPGLRDLLKQLEERAVDRDFPTFIHTANEAKVPFPDQYPLSEAVDLLLAGTDTLSIALVNILYHLSLNAHLLSTLQSSLDSLDAITLSALEKFPLLTATIKEGLRVSHGVLGRLPRIAPVEGWTFQGTYVPPGTIISSSAPIVHNDPSIFPSPDKFLPQRWLSPDGAYNVAMDQHLVAFSKGQRSCIGVKYLPEIRG